MENCGGDILKDKLYHASGSFLIVVIIYVIFCFFGMEKIVSLVFGILCATAIGLVKEYYDVNIQKDNTVKDSLKDYCANLIGIGVAVITVLLSGGV